MSIGNVHCLLSLMREINEIIDYLKVTNLITFIVSVYYHSVRFACIYSLIRILRHKFSNLCIMISNLCTSTPRLLLQNRLCIDFSIPDHISFRQSFNIRLLIHPVYNMLNNKDKRRQYCLTPFFFHFFFYFEFKGFKQLLQLSKGRSRAGLMIAIAKKSLNIQLKSRNLSRGVRN